ncbi:MAG: PEP-CTERM sorting domain-containing protein [Mariniblastus sp.]
MKKCLILLVFSAALLLPGLVSADLVAGWDNFTNPDNGFVNDATSTLTGFSGGAVTNDNVWGQSATGNSSSTSFGDTLSGASGSGSGLTLNNGTTGFVDFTVTNSTGSDYDLDFIHFDLGTTRPGAADAWTLSIESGPVSTGDVDDGVNPNGGSATPAWTGYDIALAGLADNTLEDGQAVVFRLTFARDSTQGPGGHHQYLDNIALSGTLSTVPEPSSLAVIFGVGALGLLVRRRK